MFKKPNYIIKSKILDTLHYGFVSICMGVTVISTAYLFYRGYKFVAEDRPLVRRQQKKELLAEGAHDRDKAPVLEG